MGLPVGTASRLRCVAFGRCSEWPHAAADRARRRSGTPTSRSSGASGTVLSTSGVAPSSAGFADMADAATWALDALTFGLRGVAGPPSSVAFALYAWARRSDENRETLIPFLARSGCEQLTRISTPSGDRLYWAPIRNSFAYALTALEQDGLAVTSAVSA